MPAADTLLDAERLARFLVERGVDVRGPLRVELLAGGRSNLTFKVSDDRGAWVVRHPPLAGRTASAHDVLREFAVVAALAGTAVPVAPAVAADPGGLVTGSPLCVVGFVPGLVIRDRAQLDALDDVELDAIGTALVDTLVALHAVDYRAVGLESFGRPAGFVERQAATWARQWQHVKTRELPDVDRLAAKLTGRRAPVGDATVVHGDFRIDNVLIDPAADPGSSPAVRAVLDWEMSTLGDPITDVALTCAYRLAALDDVLGAPAAWTSPRLPDADAMAQRYALASGRDLGDWAHYLALACLKIAVIAEGIAYRARQSRSAGDPSASNGIDGDVIDDEIGPAHTAALATPRFAAAGLAALH